jgi:hypothetical protein
VSATCERFFEAVWHREGPGWTGGDGAQSVPLPNGDDAWLFGDTFLGTVGSEGSRPLTVPIVHNSIALQRGTEVVTFTGPDGGPMVADPAAGSWYWPGHGVVEGNHLASSCSNSG